MPGGKRTIPIFVIIFIASIMIVNVDALSISTNKKVYYYGDFLTFMIEVDDVTEQFATIWIQDEKGTKSSPINIPITEKTTTITSPFPFESITYPQGTYIIDLEYNDEKARTEFVLRDSGRIVIPPWIKDVTKMWTDDMISGQQFASAIEFLIKENIITVPVPQSNDNRQSDVPEWVKTNAKWWIDGTIDDQTFALSLQHLIKIGIIVV